MARNGGDWGVVGVSLKRPQIRDLLVKQDFVYHACALGPDGTAVRRVETLTDILFAPEDPSAVLEMMADPMVRIVSLTITEKGYCHLPLNRRLDRAHPDVVQDLSTPNAPASAIGYICRALDLRRRRGLAAFTVLSCDNLVKNGQLVRDLVLEMCADIDPALRDWVRAHGAFPSSMVDRIVPATTPANLKMIQQLTGLSDCAPVMHEPFR